MRLDSAIFKEILQYIPMRERITKVTSFGFYFGMGFSIRMKLFLTLFTVGVILLAGVCPSFLSSLCSVQYIRPVEQPTAGA